MRLLLFAALLLPLWVKAQPAQHKTDYYILADSLGTRHQAALRLIDYDEVEIKEPGRPKRHLHAPSLAFCQIAGGHFYSLGNFEVRPGHPNSRVRMALAQLLDSGRVMMFSYYYTAATLRPMLVSGLPLPGIGSGVAMLYLLRAGPAGSLVAFPTNKLFGGNQYFREALQPYLTDRPDLRDLLLANRLRSDDLPDIVRALNLGKPFARTVKVPFGVD